MTAFRGSALTAFSSDCVLSLVVVVAAGPSLPMMSESDALLPVPTPPMMNDAAKIADDVGNDLGEGVEFR